MIPFNVPAPLSSFLEAYDRAKGALRDAGHLDTNFTVHDSNGNLIDLKTVQQVLGHKSAATTTIYQELPESEVREVLKRTGKGYDE